jgi:adenylate cyclase
VRLFRSRRLVHALIGVTVFLAVAGLYWFENAGRTAPLLNDLEFGFQDTLTATGRLNPPDNRLVFLALDNASRSLSEIDLKPFARDLSADSPEYRALTLMTVPYPWSREVYALLCDRLLAAGARAVIFDIVFESARPGDEAFQDVIRRFPDRIVLGMDFKLETIGPGRQATSWTIPNPSIIPDSSEHHPSVGFVTFLPGFNGVIRSALYQTTLEQLSAGLPPQEENAAPSSLALRAAMKLGSVDLTQPFRPRLFRFTGPPGTYPPVPLYQVFAFWRGNFGNGEALRDKVVLVGPAGTIAHDEHVTPFGMMPGPEVHLNMINALLHHAFLRELPRWIGNLLIALAVIAAWLLTILLKKTWLRGVAFVLLGAAYLFTVKLSYDYGDTVVLGIPPFLAFGVAGLVSFVYDFTHETLEKLRIRRTLEAYVSKDVVREVLDNPASYLSKLGGQRENVALIVTDLRGFTTMSEEMDSHQLVAQLNEYLSLMVDDIFSRRGSVDKFIGDAILAVWGHVKSEGAAQDATLAIEAAFLMKESLRRLNADWESRGLKTFHMGIGINFGEVIFGNIGSSRKMEPTVIGDAVNTASRLEGLTKDYGRDLLIGEAVADLVKDGFRLQFVDWVTMKGKTKPLRIYSVVSRKDAAIEPQMTAYLEAYNLAHVSYSAGNFPEALSEFEKCVQHAPDDALLQVYIERCKELMERPVEGAWTGVHVAKHK